MNKTQAIELLSTELPKQGLVLAESDRGRFRILDLRTKEKIYDYLDLGELLLTFGLSTVPKARRVSVCKNLIG